VGKPFHFSAFFGLLRDYLLKQILSEIMQQPLPAQSKNGFGELYARVKIHEFFVS